MKKLPIGVQNFEEIRKEDYYYVDKTHFIKKLVDTGKYFFLSRPRRFGKSLFLDTLACAFEGRKELFEGLFLEKKWNWEEKYPVIRFDFAEQKVKSAKELERFIFNRIKENAERMEVDIKQETYYESFMELIKKTAETKKKQVVLLIDEYDKPILDNLEDRKKAKEIREVLKGFYQVIKPADPYLRFVFLTGVSKFSKVSLFSGLNNLHDITLHPEFNEICGYTQKELETTFADRISELVMRKDEDIIAQIKMWYNGYRWGGAERLYNPFDILLFLSEGEFEPFWFETGTPQFLMDIIMERRYPIPKLEEVRASRTLLDSFDVDRMEVEAILFQTGYLTVKDIRRGLTGMREFILTYPNFEVKTALNEYILKEFTRSPLANEQYRLQEIISRNDIEGLKELFYQFFASIPYDWYRRNKLSEYEGYYASVFYAYFASAGFDVRAEDTTSQGRIDMTVLYNGRAYIFEFKVVRDEKEKGKAIAKIKERRYWEKYSVQEIYLIGIEFAPERRNISAFEWEKLS